MQKKIIIISVVVILAIAILGAIYMFAPKKVDKLSNVKITDTYGNEIENYEENTMPFTIEKDKEEVKISVNGKKYNSGERIYKVGKYKVVVEYENKKEQSTVAIKQVEKSEEHIYKIYVVSETLQTLLANLNISSNANQKGFIWTARTSTLNMEKMKENIPNLQISNNNGTVKPDEFKKNILPEIKEYVKKVLQEDPNAYFELYMEEDKFYVELELFGKIGLDDSRYEVTMYTNGTLGYVRQYEITGANKYERFRKEKEDYMGIVETIKNNTIETNDYPGSYLVDSKSTVFAQELNYDYMYISTLLRDNIKLLLQYPEMIKFEDKEISKEMQEAKIEKIVMKDEFSKLEEQEKQIFFDHIGLNKEELDQNYFTDETKEYLIITGTTPFYGEYNNQEKFESIIKQVSEEYGKEYVLLYKPHPRALPTEEQEKFLNNLGIKVLPGKLPMEAISFVYPNLKLGGFDSSLYMSTDKGETLFFFASDKNELWSPLDVLYDTVFSNAKFYN